MKAILWLCRKAGAGGLHEFGPYHLGIFDDGVMFAVDNVVMWEWHDRRS
jgi:hypothetical protein